MLSAQMQPVAFQTLMAERKREDEQAFKASESAEARKARAEALAAQSADRMSQYEIARLDREAAEARARAEREATRKDQRAFATSEREARERFAAQQGEENRRFREIMVKAVSENKPLTEFQGRNVLFGARMAESDRTLADLEDKISTTGLAAKQAIQNAPLIGGAAGAIANVALSKDQQRVEQAQRDFVNAVLRQESGAVINPSEFANAQKQYFPQPGDTKEVIEQKRKNRKLAIDAFKVLAGPGASQIDTLINTPRMPGTPTQSGSGVIDFSQLPADRRGR